MLYGAQFIDKRCDVPDHARFRVGADDLLNQERFVRARVVPQSLPARITA
jgi:hypothetical protein